MTPGSGTGGTVVCGVATGDTAKPLIDVARGLAQAHKAQLVVAHVFDAPSDDTEHVSEAVRRETMDDRHVETRLVEGSPADRLLAIAADEDADWLVVGSGGVSQEIAQRATCPVAIVPVRAER